MQICSLELAVYVLTSGTSPNALFTPFKNCIEKDAALDLHALPLSPFRVRPYAISNNPNPHRLGLATET